jgi:hypothetical protein
MFVIMGLYEGMRGEEREEKRMIENEYHQNTFHLYMKMGY